MHYSQSATIDQLTIDTASDRTNDREREREREREIVRHFASFASTDCQHQHQRQIPSVKLAERGGAIADALTREINRRATRTRFAVQETGRKTQRLRGERHPLIVIDVLFN